MNNQFKKELEELLNKFSMENGSKTPSTVLADYLVMCLHNFNETMKERSKWYAEDKVESFDDNEDLGE